MTNILVIDDDPDMAALLGQMTRMSGYESTVVKSGKAAVAAVETTPPDVILLDVMMAEVDGWTTYEQLRALTAAPVIFITAWHTAENAARAKELGESFMTKPLTPESLATRLEAALAQGKASEEKESEA